MALLDKVLHSHSQASSEPAHGPNSTSTEKSREESPAYSLSAPTSSQGVSAPDQAKASLPQDVTRPYPQYQSSMQNAGINAGAVVGSMGEGFMVGDMVTGGVVGGLVGQRIGQAQNHAFYRDQAMQYREGRAAGTIPPPEEIYVDGSKSSWWSTQGRAQRRAERWERRAKRAGDI
uniref:Glycine zipper 2TM domain-containing protein n=1 Tax=Bionectria ochroleuca TaxID=29856 RepID=A0A8H7K9E7_BIOOC